MMILVAGPYRSGTADDPAARGADQDVRRALELGLPVYGRLEDVLARRP